MTQEKGAYEPHDLRAKGRTMRHLILHLLPRTHRTRVSRDGCEHFIVWRQWLNRVWSVDDITVG